MILLIAANCLPHCMSFFFERFSPRGRKQVILGPAIVLGCPPLRLDSAAALHAAEGREQRSRVDMKDAATHLINAQSDAITMDRLQCQRFQHQHFERALNQVTWAIVHLLSSCLSRGTLRSSGLSSGSRSSLGDNQRDVVVLFACAERLHLVDDRVGQRLRGQPAKTA